MFFVKFYSVKKYIQQVQNQNTDVCKILGEKISTFCVLSIMQNCLSFSDALDQLKVIDFSKFLTKFCIFKSVGHRPSAWYRIVITPPTHPHFGSKCWKMSRGNRVLLTNLVIQCFLCGLIMNEWMNEWKYVYFSLWHTYYCNEKQLIGCQWDS